MSDRIQERMDDYKMHPGKPYRIRYKYEVGHFGKGDVDSENTGLTQDLILISCITQPSGVYSQTWMARDGLTGKEMHHQDVFKAWILMASSLREKDDLNSADREFCNEVFETWREATLNRRVGYE